MLVFNFKITMFIRKSSTYMYYPTVSGLKSVDGWGKKQDKKYTVEYTVESSLFVGYQFSVAFWSNPCQRIYNHLFTIDPNYPDYI